VCALLTRAHAVEWADLLQDDVCNFPSGSDTVFHQKMGQEFSNNQYFE
jgi:hypothetical protein